MLFEKTNRADQYQLSVCLLLQIWFETKYTRSAVQKTETTESAGQISQLPIHLDGKAGTRKTKVR